MSIPRISWLVLLLTVTLAITACGDGASEAGDESTDLTGSTDSGESTAAGDETEASDTTSVSGR